MTPLAFASSSPAYSYTASSYTPGVDVSHYQGEINWSEVRAAGIQFAFIKATQGTTIVDSMLVQNANGCKLSGIPFGCYHFFEPAQDAEQQAEFFLSAVNGVGNLLPYVLDLEVPGVTIDQVNAFANTLNALNPGEMLVYCSPGFASSAFPPSDASQLIVYPLWVAEYTSASSPTTAPWPDWEFWQYSDSGTVSGISVPVDLDWFHGTMEDLKARFSI